MTITMKTKSGSVYLVDTANKFISGGTFGEQLVPYEEISVETGLPAMIDIFSKIIKTSPIVKVSFNDK